MKSACNSSASSIIPFSSAFLLIEATQFTFSADTPAFSNIVITELLIFKYSVPLLQPTPTTILRGIRIIFDCISLISDLFFNITISAFS